MKLESIETNAKIYGVPIIRTQSHKILEKYIKKYNPKHILEIGTAVGYSGITMLSNCDGNLITIEHNKDYIAKAKTNFKKVGLNNRVEILEGDCMVILAKMLCSKNYDEYFDFIFLDGPKAQYNSMLEMLIFLLKPNGIFLADNVLFRGYVEGEIAAPTKRYKTIIKRLNDFIENCKNNPFLTEFELNNTEDGIIFAKKVQK